MNFRFSSLIRRFILNVRSVLAVLAALVLCAHGSATAQTTEPPAPKLPPTLSKVRDTGVVTIAYRPDAIPFAYLDENKQPIGYGIELSK